MLGFGFAFATLQSEPQADWVAKLGRERATFADIPNSGNWKFVWTGAFFGTYTLFPFGSSSVRYYSVATKVDRQYRLVKTRRVNGKTVKDWMILVDFTKGARYSDPGTLYNYAVRGAQIKSNLTPKIIADLRSKTPLAGYRIDSMVSYCFAVFENGDRSKSEPWDTKDYGENMPLTAAPYTITKIERDYLAKTGKFKRSN